MARRTHIQPTPPLSSRAFWDIDLRTLDFDRHAAFIITRVFEHGTPEEKEAITRFYGRDKITATLTQAHSLLPAGREWAKQMFHLSDADFLCCRSNQPARNYSRF